ncbi:MAG TPA: DUF1343 domain-containing protein [Candidatus Acidoferrales bacterium]|nr:DUF1343 domain-containing protein [Candidatus Acidoferrales bacterium]
MFRFRSQLAIWLVTVFLVWAKQSPRRTFEVRATPSGPVLVGVDVLEEQNFDFLRGKHVGLITNQTGVDSGGRRTIDVLANAPGVKLVALFSPEHGIAGKSLDAVIGDSTDGATALPIYSLYGTTRRPTDEMLKGIDLLVFDLQDVGVRFYTYVTTMAYSLEAAGSHHIPFVILDRPDPLGGNVIEGPMLDPDRTSFTAYFPLPVRYGMTIGELARLFNTENHVGADLRVVRLRNWSRLDAYDRTGLSWISPSPNLRTFNEAVVYPGIEILEAGGVSVGRGTDSPFEVLGAPWIHAEALASELNRRTIPGVRFESTSFSPGENPYKGESCSGIKILLTNRDAFRSLRLGLEIADALNRMYPEQFQLQKVITLLGSQSTIDRLARGDPPTKIIAGWSADLDKFRQMRGKYLLYQ